MNHFLDLTQLTKPELLALLKDAQLRKNNPISNDLHGKVLAMVFEKESTRTRLSFDIGMKQLGGQVVTVDAETSHLNKAKETIADTARVLSGYADCIMYRTWGHDKLMEMVENASVPVINGLTNHSHPCQVMADLLTCLEHKGRVEGMKVAWIGDANNVARSWLHASELLDIEFVVACPEKYGFSQAELDAAKAKGAHVTQTHDVSLAAQGADIVLTDTWISMGDEEQAAHRRAAFIPYQVNDALMQRAKKDAVFMHCLPAQRGEEVLPSVIDGPQSVVFQEAENRLHAQKSILLWCFELPLLG